MAPRSPRVSLAPTVFRDVDAERGTLRVPVRHAEPEGLSLELRFVRLPRRGAAGPPVVFLTGGPGLSGIRAGQGRLFPLFDALRTHGDVILLDQRACVADEMVPRFSAPDYPRNVVTRDEYLRVIRATVAQGVDALSARAIPIDALNTNESADDVAMLVRELDGDRAPMALLGWSYGSHLAMAVMKRHESMVARVVLAAPEGPDHTFKRPRAIQTHIEHLSQRSSMELVGMMARVLDRAEQDGVRVCGHRDGFVAGRFDLQWIMSELVADTRAMRKLPGWLTAMERGDFRDMDSDRLLVGALEALREELPYGVARYAMDCASGATPARREMIERESRETLLGNTIDFPTPDVCDAVGCPDLGDEFRAPPRAQTPVLFVTGTLDCRTPADNVAELAPGLPNHAHLIVEDAGHGDLLLASGAQTAIVGFVGGELVPGHIEADVPFAFDAI